MLAPGFVTLFLFSFAASWNNFYGALVMLNDKELYPGSLGLLTWNISTTESPEMYSPAITGSPLPLPPALLALGTDGRRGEVAEGAASPTQGRTGCTMALPAVLALSSG